jgi:hypothetical protein
MGMQSPVAVTIEMPGTPLWLTLITLAISIVALGVSGLQYMLSRTERNRTIPAIRMTGIYTDKMMGYGPEPRRVVSVTVQNTGRESTNLTQLLVRGNRFLINGLNALLEEVHEQSAIGLRRIEGYSQETFTIGADDVTEDAVVVLAHLGHGIQLTMNLRLNQPGVTSVANRSSSRVDKAGLSRATWLRSKSSRRQEAEPDSG